MFENDDKEVVDAGSDGIAKDGDGGGSKEFDKTRQQLDQERANVRKLQRERDTANEQLTHLQQQSEQMQRQLEDLRSAKSAEQSVTDTIPDIPEDADIDTIARTVKQYRKLLADQAKELATLKTQSQRRETETAEEKRQRLERERRNAILNEVCEELESEYGPYRNEAIKLMEEKNEELGVPKNPAAATLRLRACFKEAKAAKESKKKGSDGSPIVDPGGGGRSSLSKTKIKKGSLDEVSAQLLSRK